MKDYNKYACMLTVHVITRVYMRDACSSHNRRLRCTRILLGQCEGRGQERVVSPSDLHQDPSSRERPPEARFQGPYGVASLGEGQEGCLQRACVAVVTILACVMRNAAEGEGTREEVEGRIGGYRGRETDSWTIVNNIHPAHSPSTK